MDFIRIMKIQIFAFVLLLWVGNVYSQNFEAYIIGGVSFSQVDGDKLAGYNKAGLVAGGVTSFELKDGWAFQQEIVYYMRGSRATNSQLSIDNFSFRKLDYIDLIAQMKLAINDDWAAIGGMGYGIFVNVKSDVPEIKSSYRGDIFGTLGVQYLLSEKWYVLIKGQYSLISANKLFNAYNNSIHLSLRYRLF